MSEKDYSDIINYKYTGAPGHRMKLTDRAAQFSPFAALSGYEAKIAEAGRMTNAKPVLTDEEISFLNEKLNRLKNLKHPRILLTYFQKDLLKEGGSVISVKSYLKKLDETEKRIILDTGEKIAFEDIIGLEELYEKIQEL